MSAPRGRPAEPVRAPRGAAISCKGWAQEAALRMLMNNLDPDVAERWEDLAVDDEVLPALGDVGVEVVHEHPERRLLRPALARDRGPTRRPDRLGGTAPGRAHLHRHDAVAAVHVDDLARDARGHAGGQEERGVADLAQLDVAAQGRPLRVMLEHL